jgi:hypothetical protein
MAGQYVEFERLLNAGELSGAAGLVRQLMFQEKLLVAGGSGSGCTRCSMMNVRVRCVM